MTIRVQLEFADQAALLAFFGGNAAAAVAATTTAKAEKPAKEEKAAAPAPAPAPAEEKQKPKKTDTPKYTLDDIKAALLKVKENVSQEKARHIRDDIGESSNNKMDGIPEANYPKVMQACADALEGKSSEEEL